DEIRTALGWVVLFVHGDLRGQGDELVAVAAARVQVAGGNRCPILGLERDLVLPGVGEDVLLDVERIEAEPLPEQPAARPAGAAAGLVGGDADLDGVVAEVVDLHDRWTL